MNLYKEMQKTLAELSRARGKAGPRFNQYNYIKSRAINTVQKAFTQRNWTHIHHTLQDIPHKLTANTPGIEFTPAVQQAIINHLVDDFTRVVMLVDKNGGDIAKLFICDEDFARDIYHSHSIGWFDTCEDCGRSIQLKFDPTSYAIKLAHNNLSDSRRLVCAFKKDSSLTFKLQIPSKKVVVSDELNQFVISHNHYLSEQYDQFVKAKLNDISSTSRQGNRYITEFYAEYNLGCLYVEKGLVEIESNSKYTCISRGDVAVSSAFHADNRSGQLQQQAPYTVHSLYLSMMDYAEFSGLCNQLGLNCHETLSALNARIIDISAETLHITQYDNMNNHLLIVVKAVHAYEDEIQQSALAMA